MPLTTTERFINDCHHETLLNDYPGFVSNIRKSLDETGMAVFENFIHPDCLRELRSSVDKLMPLCYSGDKRKYLTAELRNTGFYEVTFSKYMI